MQDNRESSELRSCYTCGICESIYELVEIETHECVQGYHQIITDENLYFYAKDGKSLVNEDEQVVADNSCHNESAQNASWMNEKIRLEEQLISEVRQRPPLWNFKLPLIERGIRRKEILWEEISIRLNRIMSTKEFKKKWKSLCDSFRAHCKKKKLPSGSAASSSSSWVHYNSMQFLLDSTTRLVCNITQTTTNALNTEVPATDDTEAVNENYEMDTNISSDRCARNSSTSKWRRLDGDDDLQDLVEALVKPVTFDQPLHINVDVTKSATGATVTELAREDSVTHFTRFMESELRKIEDEDAQNEIIRNLFEVLFDTKRELMNKHN
ncbi:PREDICTED: uncharacterized protein LOC108774639 [Cyphomyrmex costatus]|uniref:uncharacterized protein LOC108774639 n=1 Tax=Cyphomyrmex costatus TaxID=456900 RepID=UPI000852292D|nr:PREDICTED: uncharacterized protein LOC108774639 [Cyphomyrmex costatus]